MIVTLAGHVDHGKTALVRALTGIDTDRLAEEQRRGLTIDLGFAYLRADGAALGFVDVPGHHRFVHNMVAGVAATQQALLVVAADDGPMPQSREHLQILQLLGLRRGVVAISKCDRVSAQRIAEVREAVTRLVCGTFLENAPLVETAIDDPASITLLRQRLLAGGGVPDSDPAPFRLAIDRSFSLKGAGLVCTGTVHAGAVADGQELFVFPAGRQGRVRGLRVSDRTAERAVIGDRTAVNLAGVDAADCLRGSWLTDRPQTGHTTLVLDFSVLDDVPRPLRHLLAVHVYHATSHATARLALLDGRPLGPGSAGLVELRLDEPLLAKRGDRLLVRAQGLDRTLGGGTVIDNRTPAGRHRSPTRLREIDACRAADPGAALDGLLALGPVAVAGFRGLWPMADESWSSLGVGRDLHEHDGSIVTGSRWAAWRESLAAECRQRHEADPTLDGIRENDFRTALPRAWRGRVLTDLVGAGELEQRAGRFRPRRHQADLSAEERALLERLGPLLDVAQPPSLGDIGRSLRIPLATLQSRARALAGKGLVVLINDKRVYLPARLDELAAVAEALSSAGPFSARDYRDRAAIGRNVAIDVLEYFDARGFTRRLGDTRTVVGQRSRLVGPLG